MKALVIIAVLFGVYLFRRALPFWLLILAAAAVIIAFGKELTD